MYEARWEIYTNKKMEHKKINKEYFGDLQEAVDFLKKKKERIKKENWISGKVAERKCIVVYKEIETIK